MVRFLISRPIAVSMTTVALLVLGFVTLGLLPVSLMPDVDIPKITVQVTDANASARELENSVVKSLRAGLNQVSHLSDIKSETLSGGASIKLTFEHGTNIDFAFIKVNEKIDRAMAHMPQSIDRPKVIKASATDIPVFYLNLTLKSQQKNNSAAAPDQDTYMQELFPVDRSFIELSNFADQVIRRRIEQLPSVALADVSGLVYPELLIVPNTNKLNALGIQPTDLESALNKYNIDVGKMLIRDGQYQFNIRVGNRLLSAQDIRQVYLKKEGRLYQLQELAEVVEHPQERAGLVTDNGKDAITMAIIKQSDARMEDLKQELNSLLDHFKADYPEIAFATTRNQTKLLDYTMANLQQSLYWGALLAFLVMFFFLKDFKSPLLIGISIPVSLIVSLLCFYFMGISINIVSLSGLVLGIGMMIDNSIIVIDNIHQHRQRTADLVAACTQGTNEVFRPMLSSVFTTCAVFIPLVFMGNVAGAIFYDQAVAVTIGLLVSLLVSVSLLPVYYRLFYTKWPRMESAGFLVKLNRINYEKWYEKGLRFTLRHQLWVWLMVLLMLSGTVILYRNLEKSQFPEMEKIETLAWLDWNEQLTIDENSRRVQELADALGAWAAHETALVGEQQLLLDRNTPKGAAEALVYFKAHSSHALDSIFAYSRQFMADRYPQAHLRFEDAGNIFELLFADDLAPLEARLRTTRDLGPEYNSRLLASIKLLADSLPAYEIPSILWDNIMVLKTKPEQLVLYGVSYQVVYNCLKRAFRQNEIFTIKSNQDFVPVILGDKPQQISAILKELKVKNQAGETVWLSSLLSRTNDRDLKAIVAGRDGEYYPVPLQPTAEEVPRLIPRINKLLHGLGDFEADFEGSHFKSRALVEKLTVILIISLLLLYFILAAQFESMVLPLIVLLEVPIDIFGAFLFLKLFGGSINLMSMIGIVVMSGIIINDSILKVDTMNRLRKEEGYSLLRAITVGGHRRLKPILMTSLTTILALIPLWFASGMGADLQRPLAISITGGMILGTLVSLFFIPLCYYYLMKIKSKPRPSRFLKP